MSNASRIPSLAEVIRGVVQGQLEDVHVAIPVRVESYDAATQKVSVQPVIKRAFLDEEGERQVDRLPVITGCPVQFPQGGGFRITFPIAVGDTGVLLFSEASLDVWLSEGGEVDPLDDRRFDLSDGVFLPGVRSFKTPISDASSDHMTLGAEGGLQIHIDASSIRIGSDNGAELEAAALGDTIQDFLGNAANPASLRAWLVLLSTFLSGLGFATPLPATPTLKSTTVEVKK